MHLFENQLITSIAAFVCSNMIICDEIQQWKDLKDCSLLEKEIQLFHYFTSSVFNNSFFWKPIQIYKIVMLNIIWNPFSRKYPKCPKLSTIILVNYKSKVFVNFKAALCRKDINYNSSRKYQGILLLSDRNDLMQKRLLQTFTQNEMFVMILTIIRRNIL